MNAIVPVREGAKALVDEIAADLQTALPPTIPLDKFKATFITAVAHNPDILSCDPQSVKTSLMKAAIDNLMPDNREAAIVPFNTKVKGPDGRDVWVKLAQYMPMVQGIRKRALELGGARITAEVVYENDHFDAVLGDDPHLEHKPAKLGQARGEIVGAYAIYKDESGNILHREVMDKSEIEASRNVSRAKDGPGWRNFYGEFARKTVVRRGAKSIPNIPDRLRTIIERDDDYVDFEQVDTRQRTIDHNPLVDEQRQIESNSQQSMETVDRSTGEVIENTGAQRGTAGKQTAAASEGDKPAASAKPSESSDGGRGEPSRSDDRAQSNSSESQPASSTAADDRPEGDGDTSSQHLSRAVFTKFATTVGRYKSAENVSKGVKKFFEDEGIKAGTQKERELFATIRDQYIASVINGGMDVGKFLAEVNGWIEQDIPEDAL